MNKTQKRDWLAECFVFGMLEAKGSHIRSTQKLCCFRDRCGDCGVLQMSYFYRWRDDQGLKSLVIFPCSSCGESNWTMVDHITTDILSTGAFPDHLRIPDYP